jgi:sulfonate transport system permease protein
MAMQNEAIVNTGAGSWRGFLFPVGLLLCWILAVRFGLIGHRLASPASVLAAATTFFLSGGGGAAIAMSLARFACGWLIGSMVGLLIGFAIGLSRTGDAVGGGTFNALRQIALFAWIPLLTAWFGQGDGACIAFIALATIFPVALNTQAGCRTVPLRFLEVARVLEFGTLRTIRVLILPAAAPSILAGMQLGLMAAWVATIGAEYLIDSGVGIGVTIAAARQLNDLSTVIVGVMVLGTVGLALDRMIALGTLRLVRVEQT